MFSLIYVLLGKTRTTLFQIHHGAAPGSLRAHEKPNFGGGRCQQRTSAEDAVSGGYFRLLAPDPPYLHDGESQSFDGQLQAVLY